MILCDTNILIEFYKANPSVIQTLQHIGSANIAVSVITKAELFYGARDKQELVKIFYYALKQQELQEALAKSVPG